MKIKYEKINDSILLILLSTFHWINKNVSKCFKTFLIILKNLILITFAAM